MAGWYITLIQCCFNLAGLLKAAACALPIIICLGLIAGRRGNAQFCLQGNFALAHLTICLAILSAFYFPGIYLFQILAIRQPENSIWGPFFSLPGLPWSGSFCVWLLGCLLLFKARTEFPKHFDCNVLNFTTVRKSIIWFIWTACCFASTFVIMHWPFAGLPSGMSMSTAISAIARNAAHQFFMTLTPAGAIALVWLTVNQQKFEQFATQEQISMGFRWFAVWAVIGYLPSLLQNWSLVMNTAYRPGFAGPMTAGYHTQVTGLCFITFATGCWIMSWFRVKLAPVLGYIGLGLLVLKESVPLLIKIL